MSFTNPVEIKTTNRCWQNNYRWSGGTKIITNPDGTQEPKCFAVIRHSVKKGEDEWENIEEEPRMKMAVVGFTTALQGDNGEKEASKRVRYFSNEVLSTFDQPLTVFAKDASGTSKLYDNVMYSDIKKDEKRPTGLKYTIYVYFYNFGTKMIDRFEMSGSARGAWFDLDKKDNAVHKSWLIMKAGKLEINGSVTFIPPVLEYGDKFSQEEINEIINSDAYKAYDAWEKSIGAGAVEYDNGLEEIDQTPEHYDGELSQEPATQPRANITNLEGVPF